MSSLKSLSRNTANTEAHTGCFCNWNLYKFTYFLEISCEASWQSGQITTYFSHERIPWKKWFYSSLEITRFIFIIWSIQSDNQSLTNMQFLGPMPTPILGSKKIPIWIYRLIYTHQDCCRTFQQVGELKLNVIINNHLAHRFCTVLENQTFSYCTISTTYSDYNISVKGQHQPTDISVRLLITFGKSSRANCQASCWLNWRLAVSASESF